MTLELLEEEKLRLENEVIMSVFIPNEFDDDDCILFIYSFRNSTNT